MPQYGQQHERITNPLFVSSVKTTPLQNSRTSVRVDLTYQSPQAFLANGTSITGETTTSVLPVSLDPTTRQPLVVRYTPPKNSDGTQPPTQTNNVRLKVPVPHCILRFERIEMLSPLAAAQRLIGCVNNGNWQNGAQYTWMLRAMPFKQLGVISGTTGGNSPYQVAYEFEYRPDGWYEVFLYRDPIRNEIPTDIAYSQNNDKGIYLWHPAAVDFNQLKLPNAYAQSPISGFTPLQTT